MGVHQGDISISSCYQEEIFEKLTANRQCPVIVPIEHKHPHERKKLNIQICKFLEHEFTKNIKAGSESEYRITAAIAEFFLANESACGLVYPAIAMRANVENFALTPESVDKSLELESVKFLRIDKSENFSYTVTVLEYSDAFLSDGKIMWRLPTQEEKKYL